MVPNRAIAFGITLALLTQPALAAAQASPPGTSAAYPGNRGTPAQPRSGNNGGGDIGTGGILAILGVIGAGVAVASLAHGDWIPEERLLSEGPQFEPHLAADHFRVQGFAAPGWPVSIDFETGPGVQAALHLQVKGMPSKLLPPVLLPPGEGRRVVVVTLPAPPEFDGVRQGRYTLVAAAPDARGRLRKADLHVYGIGAGPRAVGSMTLFVRGMAPLSVTPRDDVTFDVDAQRRFDRSVTEVMRLPDRGNDLVLTRDVHVFPLAVGLHHGRWSTMDVQSAEVPGRYWLQARAWFVGAANDQRDWTGAIGRDIVVVAR